MRRKYKDLTGMRFGRWLVLEEGEYKDVGKGDGKRLYWKCKCDCGTVREVIVGRLQRGSSKSCGCLALELIKSGVHTRKHGLWNTRIWNIWKAMTYRCKYLWDSAYRNYGGRGIRVCERWQKFENFFDDMGSTYRKGLTIERMDNNGNYEPTNCEWITLAQQQRNKRSNHNITFNGKTQCITAWAEEIGIKASTLISRITELGWSNERALTTKINDRNNNITYKGKTQCLTAWAREFGMAANTLKARLTTQGLSIEKSLTTPIKGGNHG